MDPAPKAPGVEVIGREAEMHQLRTALDEARLADALERIAAERGARTLGAHVK